MKKRMPAMQSVLPAQTLTSLHMVLSASVVDIALSSPLTCVVFHEGRGHVTEGKRQREVSVHSHAPLTHNVSSMHMFLSTTLVDIALASQLTCVVFHAGG